MVEAVLRGGHVSSAQWVETNWKLSTNLVVYHHLNGTKVEPHSCWRDTPLFDSSTFMLLGDFSSFPIKLCVFFF